MKMEIKVGELHLERDEDRLLFGLYVDTHMDGKVQRFRVPLSGSRKKADEREVLANGLSVLARTLCAWHDSMAFDATFAEQYKHE